MSQEGEIVAINVFVLVRHLLDKAEQNLFRLFLTVLNKHVDNVAAAPTIVERFAFDSVKKCFWLEHTLI